MSALEHVPMFASVRLELMEEVVGGSVAGANPASEFRIAVRIEPEATIHEWDGLEAFRTGVLPESFASAGEVAAGAEAPSQEVAP